MNIWSNKIVMTAAVLLAIFCLLRSWDYGQRKSGVDFYQFWAVGQTILQNRGVDIYSNEMRQSLGKEFLQKAYQSHLPRFIKAALYRQNLETYSTPFLYSLFVFSLPKNYDQAYTYYQVLCLACMIFSVVMLGRLLGMPFTFSLILLSFFISCFEPYLSDVRVANVNQIQLGLMVLFLWLESRLSWKARYFLAGAVLGISIMFKPNLIFVVLMLSLLWAVKGEFTKIFQQCAGMGVAVAGVVVFSSIIFGSAGCWLNWFKAAADIPENITAIGLGNYSLSRFIMEHGGIFISQYLIVGLVGLVVLCFWFREKIHKNRSQVNRENELFEDTLFLGLGCLIYLLAAPLVWLHYFLLTIPMIMFLLRPVADTVFARRVFRYGLIGCLAAVISLMLPLRLFLNIQSSVQAAVMMITATFFLFVLALEDLRTLYSHS